MGEIPDPIEMGERCAERWAGTNIILSAYNEKFRCPGCELWRPLDEATPMSADPYASPLCRMCAALCGGGR